MKRDLSVLTYAGAGVLATLAGMAAGHLVAALLDPASSPVLAVGSTVIDLTPTPVKEVAVRELGRAVAEHDGLVPVLLPVGDGLLAAKKVWQPEND